MKKLYLDYAAATPMAPEVQAVMRPFLSKTFHNPSATYLAARFARQALEQARSEIAMIIGARPVEVTFTAGATEANNLAIQGVMRQFPEGEILTSAVEHDSVLAPAALYKNRQVPVNQQGVVDLKRLEAMVTEKTVLVSVMLVNNELGTVQSLNEISKLLNKLSDSRRGNLPLYLHTDAAQAPLYADLHAARLGVDMMTINGGKIYGPKQSGILYVKTGTRLQPLIVGGGQEHGLRSGTENLAAAAGLAKALAMAQAGRKDENQRLSQVKAEFVKSLASVRGAEINSPIRNAAPHILSVRFDGVDNERLMMLLDEAGIEVAVGSACSASNNEPSHVLKAIGLSNQQARATLRFSFGRDTSPASVRRVVRELARLTSV